MQGLFVTPNYDDVKWDETVCSPAYIEILLIFASNVSDIILMIKSNKES